VTLRVVNVGKVTSAKVSNRQPIVPEMILISQQSISQVSLSRLAD
jgi:hypothetical protein